MGSITDFVKKHWAKIVFGLILTAMTFGLWCLCKLIKSLRD